MKNKLFYILIFLVGIFVNSKTMAQQHKQIVRIAKIQVDPAQLEKYNIALKEQMNTAVKVEPGVLTYYAVADKDNPSNITILEIYADTGAYQAHIQTPHFKKYKAAVEHMVKHLELVDVSIISVAKKPGF
jgi:quinol monooxygenase YgiN